MRSNLRGGRDGPRIEAVNQLLCSQETLGCILHLALPFKSCMMDAAAFLSVWVRTEPMFHRACEG